MTHTQGTEVSTSVPKTYAVRVSGYGGEIVIGKISQESYDFWTEKNEEGETLDDYNLGDLEIPEAFRIFEPSEWQDCDDIAHECGAEMSDLNIIEVFDENDILVWSSTCSPSALDKAGVECEELSDIYVSELKTCDYVFVGQEIEKGTLYDGEIQITEPFDPSNLHVAYDNVNGWVLLSFIKYLGDGVDNDYYSTVGKSLELNIYKVE